MYLPPSPYVLMFFFFGHILLFLQASHCRSFIFVHWSIKYKACISQENKIEACPNCFLCNLHIHWCTIQILYYQWKLSSCISMVSKSDSVWWREFMQITLKKAELLFLLVHQQAPSRTTTLFVIPPLLRVQVLASNKYELLVADFFFYKPVRRQSY